MTEMGSGKGLAQGPPGDRQPCVAFYHVLLPSVHASIQPALSQPTRPAVLLSLHSLVLKSPGAAGWRRRVRRRLPARCCGRSTGSWGPSPSLRSTSFSASSCWSACGSPGTPASCPAGCQSPGWRARQSKWFLPQHPPMALLLLCRPVLEHSVGFWTHFCLTSLPDKLTDVFLWPLLPQQAGSVARL